MMAPAGRRVGLPAALLVLGFLGLGGCRSDAGVARAREPAARPEHPPGGGPGVGAAKGGAGVQGAPPSDRAAARLVTGSDSVLVQAARRFLPEVSRESGLPVTRPLAVARTTRRKLGAYLLGELDAELPPGRAGAVAAVYARLGLVPDTLDLLNLLRKLYLEQVVGYYDPHRDTLYVREGVGEDLFRPVLVHEMVHALQDEHENLDSLMRARRSDNDASTAAQAALEGQATFVMLEWQLRRTLGREVDLITMPSLTSMVGSADAVVAGAGSAPELAAAPPFIRRSLVFPYVAGLGFVQALWKARPGRPPPLGAEMPTSTEQVLHPGRFLSSPRDAPATIAFVESPSGPAAKGWKVVHADDLGEFEIRTFLSTFLDDTARAEAAAAGWDGDGYRLLRRCAPAAPACREALVWASVWDDATAADSFAVAVEAAEAGRYGEPERAPGALATGTAGPSVRSSVDTLVDAGRILEVRRIEVDGRPAVVVVDGPAGEDLAPLRAASRFAVREDG